MLKKWFGKKEAGETKSEGDALPSPPAGEVEPQDVEGDTSDDALEGTAEGGPTGASEAEERASTPEEKKSRWAILGTGLAKTRAGLKSLFTFRRKLDEDCIAEIEADLLQADFGPTTVDELIHGENGLTVAWKEKEIQEVEEVREYLGERLRQMLSRRANALTTAETPPSVVLVAGVNGTGKTTSIAKLSKRLTDQGHSVVLAAADTFRAAAVEQLAIWSERLGVEMVRGDEGADPASVAYRGAERSLETGADFLIVDTAGRLHNQVNLMRELEKIRNVLGKKIPGAPHESLLVIDATTGQNALNQARDFQKAAEISGIVLAKLDGTAKGGIAVAINNQLDIPVKFVGLGEKIDDLEAFDVDRFVDALLAGER